VIVEHRQIVDRVGGHADQITHRQHAAPTGACRCGHRDLEIVYRVGGRVELGQRGARDHRDRMPAMAAQPTRGDAGLEPEFDAVVAALRGAAVIGDLGHRAVGEVTARAHRGADRFDVGAGFGVDPPGQLRHPIATLPAQRQTATPGPVGLVEITVGVEDLIDAPGNHLDELGVILGGLAHQAALDLAALVIRHP
jgi:hypothetical protein